MGYLAISMDIGIPMVTLNKKVRPSGAARGGVGIASGIASRWSAGTAIYDAATRRT